NARAAAANPCATCCHPNTTATGSTARAACWSIATTAATSSAGYAPRVSTRPSCGRRPRALAATGARSCWLLDDDPLLRPLLAAAVLAVQYQAEPVRARGDVVA